VPTEWDHAPERVHCVGGDERDELEPAVVVRAMGRKVARPSEEG
jgi:hypothetical protein